MYRVMVASNPMKATSLARDNNKGLDFGNVVANSKGTWDGDKDSSRDMGRKLECWHYEGST